MGNQLKDMQDYAKKRQKGIGAFVNPNAGDVEKGNAMFNNATDVGSAPVSGGMGEDFESTDNMRGKKNMESINIREELNKRDMQSCKTDFVNMYESANLSLDKKKELAKLLAENKSNKVISKFFESIEGNQFVRYKGYDIEYNFYGEGEYTVQYQGDDVWFKSMDEAQAFIDELSSDRKDVPPIELEESKLNEWGNQIDEYEISDTELLAMGAERGSYGRVDYYVEKLYRPSETSAEWRVDFKKIYPNEEMARKAFERYKRKFSVSNKDLKESTSELISNEEFFNTISKEVDGADIVLGWDKKYHTFDEWVTLLLNTYKDLEQDLLDLGDYEQAKANRETVINKLLKYINAHKDLKESKETDKVVKRAKEVIGKLSDIGNASLEVEDVGALKRLRKEIDNLLGKKDLKEEYGAYKDESYCEEIADDLERESWGGYTENETEWDLEVDNSRYTDFDPYIADFLAREISYPVRDGHLSYRGLDCILTKDILSPTVDEDDLEGIIPDLVRFGLSRKEIDKWLRNPDRDAEIEFYVDYDILFDVDEWEENNKEDIDLPSELTLSIYDFNYVDGETDIDELNDAIGDYLSDEYGYCHNGFQFDVEGDKIYVYGIEWDLSENLKEDLDDVIEDNIDYVPDYVQEDIDKVKALKIGQEIKLRISGVRTLVIKREDDSKYYLYYLTKGNGKHDYVTGSWRDVVHAIFDANSLKLPPKEIYDKLLNESSQEQYIVEVQPDTEQETFNDYAGALDFYNIRVSDYRKESRNDDVSVALHKVINGEIVDTLEYWKKDESLSEGYSCFEFDEGNPYIAKTEEEKQRLLKKYGDKVEEIKPGFYKVSNKSEDTFLPEDVDLTKFTNTNTNKEPLKQATFVIDDGPRYIGYDEEYSWNGWACPWFTKEESLKIAEWLNSYIVDTLTFDETKDAFKYVPQDDSGDIDYYIGADISTEDGVKHLYPIGNKSWTWDNVSDYDDIDDDMDDFYAVKKYDLD